MPHEEQIEWPSFETVLRDVAPDSPTARSLASADRRAQYSATAEAIRSTEIPQAEHTNNGSDVALAESTSKMTLVDNAEVDSVEIFETASPAVETTSATLPEPLPPLEIDTSSIRALLEPRPAVEVDTPAVEEALRELDPLPELDINIDDDSFGDPIEETRELVQAAAPAEEVEEVHDVEDVEDVEDVDLFGELVDNEDPVALDTEPDFAPDPIEAIDHAPELDFADLAGPVDTIEFDAFEPLTFDAVDTTPDFAAPVDSEVLEPLDDDSLVFELGEDEMQQVDDAHELDAVDTVGPLDDPFSPDLFSPEDFAVAETESIEEPIGDVHDTPADNVDYSSLIVDVDDLQVDALDSPSIPELPDSVTSVPGIELPGTDSAPVEVFDDLAPMSLQGLEDVPKFEDDDSTFENPGLDLFDLNDDSDTIEQERIALRDDDLYEDSSFDSIAAADAIETDLDQLIGIGDDELDADRLTAAIAEPDMVEPDNVIPLRPDIDMDQAPATPEQQSPVAPEGPLLTSGTGWVALAPEPATHAPDPWADMRPTEEPKKTGFWANRPKFFGGDERRRRKSERRETEVEPPKQAVDVTFDKECPRCGSECQVDLDDPIGRRVHVSCPSCQNIWYTPYILEDSQTG